jgi:type I restriction enzyme S subunit
VTCVGDLIEEFKERPRADEDLPVPTLTERNGFVLQSERFKKRLATDDTSNYKRIGRDDIAFNPYLLWAGAVAQNTIVDSGVISPLYPTFRVRQKMDARYVNHLLLSPRMVSAYDGIAFGSVPRRRRSSVTDFLGLAVPPPPPLDEQRRIAAILDQVDAIRSSTVRMREANAELVQAIVEQHLVSLDSSVYQSFGDCCTRLTVGVVIRPASHYVATGVPALRTINVKAGWVDTTDLVFFSPVANDGLLSKSKLRADDLVIARTGRPGVTAVVPDSLAGGNAIDLIVATPNRAVAHPLYLELLMNSTLGKRLVLGEQPGLLQSREASG